MIPRYDAELEQPNTSEKPIAPQENPEYTTAEIFTTLIARGELYDAAIRSSHVPLRGRLEEMVAQKTGLEPQTELMNEAIIEGYYDFLDKTGITNREKKHRLPGSGLIHNVTTLLAGKRTEVAQDTLDLYHQLLKSIQEKAEKLQEAQRTQAEKQIFTSEHIFTPEFRQQLEKVWAKAEESFQEVSIAQEFKLTQEPHAEYDDLFDTPNATAERGLLRGVDAEEFWITYQEYAEHPQRPHFWICIEVIPTLEIENTSDLAFARPQMPGVSELGERGHSEVVPMVWKFDASNPKMHFINGESNRIAWQPGRHRLESMAVFSPYDTYTTNMALPCVFGQSESGELIVSVPKKEYRNGEQVYLSFLVTDAKFFIGNQSDHREQPEASSPTI
ncbi:MAG TPA: hypothetical protein VF209_01620 [Patescibacteria group bacterium]